MSDILRSWISERYLQQRVIADIIESVNAKPYASYTVLDDFFRPERLDELIAAHTTLQFSEEADRRDPASGAWLPYDGAVQFAAPGMVGSDLFFDPAWHDYCARLVGVTLPGHRTDVKLRYHRPDADGFWIHTDGTTRSMVAIAYFNHNWRADDGGLLQLWELSNPLGQVVEFNSPSGRMDFLNKYNVIRSKTPGGGLPYGMPAGDFSLIDQVVPTYNRLFLCNFQGSKAYHSITPSNGRARYNFVQWFGVQ